MKWINGCAEAGTHTFIASLHGYIFSFSSFFLFPLTSLNLSLSLSLSLFSECSWWYKANIFGRWQHNRSHFIYIYIVYMSHSVHTFENNRNVLKWVEIRNCCKLFISCFKKCTNQTINLRRIFNEIHTHLLIQFICFS